VRRAEGGAWLALSTQYAGKDKWEAEIKRHEQLLHTRLWKGQPNFSLERFIALHHNAFVFMQAAAEHVTYQLPNEHSRVGYLMEGIQCIDAGLQAALASIKTDNDPDSLPNNFEASASHLLPYDPVQRKRSVTQGKRGSADISDVTGGDGVTIVAFGANKDIGKTGVHLRYHSPEEYKTLSKAQTDELREWRKTTPGGRKKSKHDDRTSKPTVRFDTEKAIASAVEKKVAERLKSIEHDKTQGDETEAYIMSIFQKYAEKAKAATVKVSVTATPPPNALKATIKRAKNIQTVDGHPPALQASSVSSKRRQISKAMQPANQTWDPGVTTTPRNKLLKINPMVYFYSLIATIMASDVDAVDDTEEEQPEESRAELDSHANMPVVGHNAFIIADTGRVAKVNPYTPDYAPMQVKIVDVAVQYDCPYDSLSYVLIIRNALYVPAMRNNLLPPFVLHEAGIRVNNSPNIQVDEPTEAYHSICFPETNFRIPLSLWGMFSYFPTTKPNESLLNSSEEIHMLTPGRWDPHNDAYAYNEEHMLDWEGKMISRKDRTSTTILLEDIDDADTMVPSVSAAETL
jgi:hypothetical protein